MGTPRLKIKNELNYRRGYTSRSCQYCNHLVKVKIANTTDDKVCDLLHDALDRHLVNPYRCELIGLKSGRLYAINPANICDKYDNSVYMTRLKGNAK